MESNRNGVCAAAGRLAAAVCVFLVASWSADAQILWDGGAGNSFWSSAANWSGNTIPAPADNVILDNSLQAFTNRNILYDATVGANTSINSLRIGNPSTLAATNGLTVATNLTVTTDVRLVASNGLARLALDSAAASMVINGALVVTNSGSGVSVATVGSGATLTAGSLALNGRFTNSGAVVVNNGFVQGSGSYAQDAGRLQVGAGGIFVGTNSSFSTMSLSNGAVATNAGWFVAGSASTANSNSVLMAGAGTAMTMTGAASMAVGYNGAYNSLVVSNGAALLTGTRAGSRLWVGWGGVSHDNQLVITDAGSIVTSRVFVVVGESGHDNSMVITNGGALVAAGQNIYVGAALASSNNSLVVSGPGSRMSATTLLVGDRGNSNAVWITDGGFARLASSIQIGNSTSGSSFFPSNNLLVVSGAGSVLSNGGPLNVGNIGRQNSLLVQDGGAVTNAGAVTIGNALNASNNLLHITGAGSLFSGGGTLTVGATGSHNNLLVANGGSLLSAAGVIGGSAAATNNAARVTGAGSSWQIGDNLDIGTNAASANNSLTIAGGGEVRVGGGLTLGAAAVVTNDAASAFYIAGFFDNQSTNNQANRSMAGRWVFNGGGATQRIEAASNLRTGFSDTNFYFGTISVGDPVTGSNAFVQLVDVRANTAGAGVEALVASNLTIATAGSTFDLNSRTALVFNLGNAGTIQQTSGIGSLGRINAVATFTNQGVVSVSSGSFLQFSNSFVNAAAGTVALQTGGVLTNFVSGSVLTNYGAIRGVGAVAPAIGNEGSVIATGGVLRLTGGFTNTGAGGGPVNAGLLQAIGGGSELWIGQGFTNLGAISLMVGTVTATRIVNQGLISGRAVFNARLDNFAQVTNDTGGPLIFALPVHNFTNGSIIARNSSTMNFSVPLNNAGGLIRITDQSLATFATVTNLAGSRIEIANQSRATFTAGVTNHGAISVFGPSTAIFSGTLTLGPTGVITASATNSVFIMRGNFFNFSTNNTEFDMRNATVIFGDTNRIQGGSIANAELFPAAGTNKGATLAGFENNFAVHSIYFTNVSRISNPMDDNQNTNYVLYVDILRLADVNLHINHVTIYVADRFIVEKINKEYTAANIGNGGVMDTGWRDAEDGYRLADIRLTIGSDARIIFMSIPEPSTAALVGAGLLLLAGRRRRKPPQRADFHFPVRPPPHSAGHGPSS